MRTLTRLAQGIVTLAVATFASSAFAQDAHPPDAPQHESIWVTPRPTKVLELSLSTLGFLHIGETLGGGALFDATAAYHFSAPIVVGASVGPVGFGSAAGDTTVGLASAYAFAGVDSDLLEADLGGGVATWTEGQAVPEIVTRGRIGSRDGFHFRWVTGIVAVDNRFDLGMLAFGFQIPLSKKWALELDGDGGNLRSDRALLGVRYRIAGEGNHGTLDITGNAGVAWVVGSSETYVGPGIGIGLGFRP